MLDFDLEYFVYMDSVEHHSKEYFGTSKESKPPKPDKEEENIFSPRILPPINQKSRSTK